MDLKGLLPEELGTFVASMGERAFRARQLQAWMYARGVSDLDAMSDLSKAFRRRLHQVAYVSRLELAAHQQSQSGQAVKFLFRLPGGACVESVLILSGGRRTACLSCQVGCAVACTFCATGRMGFVQHLTAAQIVDQVLQMSEAPVLRGQRITNVVMMGMGEPLLNYEAVIRAVRLLRLELGPGIGGRKITLSTAGIVPQIRRLAREDLNVGLAISLNATTDAQRRAIMPIARKYPLEELLEAAREFHAVGGRPVTFGYVLLAGVNDSLDDARRLAGLSRTVPCKLNLIPYNEFVPDGRFRQPDAGRMDAFRQLLERESPVPVTVRESRGGDIDAACGQLCRPRPASGPGRP